MIAKRKRRELPDHSPPRHSFPEPPDGSGALREPPTAEQAQRLSKKHGFPADFDLDKRLKWAWEWWRGSVQSGPPPRTSERRRLMLELAKCAEGLADAIGKLGTVERRAILETFPAERLDLTALAQNARWVALAAKYGARKLPASKGGKRGEPAKVELLSILWRIYTDEGAFGPNAPRISYNRGEFTGPFFKYAEEVLELFGERNRRASDRGNVALGKAIQKVQAATRARAASRPITETEP